MIVALLAVLGVDLLALAGLRVARCARRRRVTHRPGAFVGAARAVEGETHGLNRR
ncbi:hypothetical protein ACIHIX_46710 [Streptomyces sp. NPDC051913]|uniref:hypothetical protein n=1 Tax=Streptomyces sp. NPDC051913 TaxID=3365676 RepID=UPI0037D046E9